MKYFLTLLCGVLFSLSAFAQPSNNECLNLIDLGTAPICTGDIYTNVDATSSSTSAGDVPTCFNGGVVNNDVYFGFQVDASLVNVTITITGTDMGPNGIPWENPQFALYRGDCSGLAELDCVNGAIGENMVTLDAIGLTPGLTYFLRVDSYTTTATPVWGDFTVCIEEYIPNFNMGDETFTSFCSGTIYDSGGPDGNYDNAENLTFTVCPNNFTQCLALDVQSFNLGAGDELNVYEGPSPASPLIATLSGDSNGNEFIVQSTNACITLAFTSDGGSTGAGFEATWSCSPSVCDGSDFPNATEIGSLPFNDPDLTTCGEAANFSQTPCDLPFLNGPETVFLFTSMGGSCATIELTGALPGTGVAVLNGLPDDPGTICIAQDEDGQLSDVNFAEAGDYYIIVANSQGCTDFGLNIVEAECLNNMGEETFSSDCSGTIYDSGGPTEGYGNGEESTFTICPDEPTQCIALDVQSFNLASGDELNVYEGSSTDSMLIATLSGDGNGNEFVVQSANECITLEFTSDGGNTAAGFEATWSCSPSVCDGSDFPNATEIGSLPFNNPDLTTCGEAANFSQTPCDLPFLNGPETVFLFTSMGGSCATIELTGALPGTGVAVLNGLPDDPGTMCIAQDENGQLSDVNFAEAGDYYIIVANSQGCTDFGLNIVEAECLNNMGEETASSECSGTIYDSGGPDEDYENDEASTFVICPDEPTQCIALDLQSFSIGSGDQLNIYEGDSTADPLIASLNGNSNGNEFIVEASSDCLTLEFFSDGFISSAGFVAAWECSPAECTGSDFDNPTAIGSLPFDDPNLTTCGEAANFNQTPCGPLPFLNGPETVFLYQSPGGFCVSIEVTGAEPGTGVAVLNGLPDDPGTVCVGQSANGQLNGVDFQEAGDYYIIVANADGCTDFGLNIAEDDCVISPTLVNALCNPLNGCIEEGELVSELIFQDGSEDIFGLGDAGCWLGNGFQTDYLWFTIEAQADGPFGFIMSGTTTPSDIDINVWGPFTQTQVCEAPNEVITTITSTDPIRSTWTGGAIPTGLADIHPVTGINVTDDYDCGSLATPGPGGDGIVRTIAAQEGEVYVVLTNDFGDQITDGAISIDWGPSAPEVLQPVGATVTAADTSICAGESVQLEVITGLDNIRWIGDNADQLSCNACFDPIATPPAETEVYQAVLNAACYQDTINVTVNVFNLDAGPDLEICAGEDFAIPAGPDFGMATYEWSPPPGLTFSCTDCGTPIVSAETPGEYEVPVTLTAAACNFMDMVTITVLDFTAPDFSVADDERICEGEERNIGGAEMPGNTYTWTSVPATDVEDIANPLVQPDITTTYFVSVTNGVCPLPSLDSVTIEVTPLPLIEIAETPEPICQGDTISLSSVTVEDDVTYSWNGPNEILNPDSSFTVLVPGASGNYTLTGDRLGCEVSDVQLIEVTPIRIDLQQPDTAFLCLGDSVEVDAILIPTNETIVWTPAEIEGTNPVLTPDTYTVYTATVTVGNCVRVDSFAIQVDSLPADMSIMAQPDKDPYCQGELVTLVSPIYEPANYPDLTHQWTEVIGDQTPDSLYNMVISAQDTFTYERLTINGGCVQTDTIRLNVVTNESLAITPLQPELCPGDSVQLTLAGPGQLGEITWTPSAGLSCDDCPDPIAFPTETTSYMVSSAIDGCAIMQGVTVSVLEDPSIIVANESICAGVEVALAASAGPQAGTSYTWSADNDPNFSSMEFNPLVSPAMTTTYSVTASNICGTATSEGTVFVVAEGELLSVNNGLDTVVICRGFELDLVAEVQESPNGVNGLIWNYAGASAVGAEVTFTATETGPAVFTFSYGVSGDVICNQISEEVFIQVNDAPQDVSLIANDTLCFGEQQTFILNAGSGEPGVIYSWTGSNGFTSMEPDPEVTPTETTTYVLEASLGECTVIDSVTIFVIPAADLFGGEPVVITLDDPNPEVEITPVLTDGIDSSFIMWTFLEDTIGMGAPLIWSPDPSQLDELPNFAVATLDTGCEILIDSVLVQLLDIRIPDIFSPNGDNTNDVFKPFYLGEMDLVEITIYNRWGQIVFESNDNTNPGWDGTKEDKEAPSDVYLYRVRVGLGDAVLDRQGQITLVR